MTLKSVANNARGKLNSSIGAGTLAVVLQSGQGDLFPAGNFRITLKDYLAGVLISQEILNCSSRSGDTLTVTRAVEPCPRTLTSLSQVSTAYSFSAYVDSLNGTIVEQHVTAGAIDEISTAIDTLDTEKLDIADYLSGNKLYGTSVTGTDAYETTISGITSYAQIDGQVIRVKVDVANTGGATMNVSSLGAKTIVRYGGDALQDGDIKAGQIAFLAWDNTQNVFELKDAIDQSSSIVSKNLVDNTFYAGEAITAGQAVFIESQTTFALSTTVQNIGDVVGNTRVAIPIFGTGVNFTTLKLALRKFLAPGVDLGIRIETDSSGSPSGTIVTNGSTTFATASLTTSLADTTITFGGNVNLSVGQLYWIVLFAGTYGSETINATNYFGVGYNASAHTTTRAMKVRNATVYSAGQTFLAYVSSTGILNQVLSLTDADYTYKIDFRGLSTTTVAVGGLPNISYQGINYNQSGLVYDGFTDYFLSQTPGAITSTAPTNKTLVGRAVSTTSILLFTGPNAPNFISSVAVSASLTVPSGTQVILIEAIAGSTRLDKGDITLTKYGKTTGTTQGAETNALDNQPTFTASWSGNTLTITGTATLAGTVYYYRNL